MGKVIRIAPIFLFFIIFLCHSSIVFLFTLLFNLLVLSFSKAWPPVERGRALMSLTELNLKYFLLLLNRLGSIRFTG